MKIIIGLGNPEKNYLKTRHNIGHRIIDSLPPPPPQTLYLKSDQFMNNSGIYVQKIIHFYKIKPENLYIIHDDLDLPVGDWRLHFDRGAAGHHGVESVINHLGTQAFWRFRIGIGHPTDLIPAEEYVLQRFSPPESKLIEQTIGKIITEIEAVSRARS